MITPQPVPVGQETQWHHRGLRCARRSRPLRAYLLKHPRFHKHFIPTSSSWLNLIECWFRELTDKMIRRGAFKNVDRLIAAITQFIDHHNDAPKSFVWTAKAQEILAKVGPARAVPDNGASG